VQLLRGCLHSYYQNQQQKPINKIVWYQPDDKGTPVETPFAVDMTKHWRISQRDLKAKIDQGFLPGISMALQHLHEQYQLNGAQCFHQEQPNMPEQVFTTPEELHCGVLYNVLALLGHVNPQFSSIPQQFPDGSFATVPALQEMSQCFLRVPPQFEKECFVFVELLKLGIINGAPYAKKWNPASVAPQPNHDRAMEVALLSRVFSLLSITPSGKAWSTEFDHELMCFNSIVTKMTKALRSLFEMQLLHFIIKRRTTLDSKTFVDIANYLPYKEDVGVGMGVVTKTLLEKVYVEQAPNILDTLPSMFPACANVVEDLQTAMKFWDVVMIIVGYCRSTVNGFPPELADEFDRANEFLMQQKYVLHL